MNQASEPRDATDSRPEPFLGGTRREALAATIAFVVVTLVYLATMMPGPAFMDTGEFQTVTYVLGVAHPTGYPLYTILGKIFGTLVPIGSWAYRMNLLSVLCAASAAVMLTIFALRAGASSPVALAATMSFAFALNTSPAPAPPYPY